MTVEVDRTLLRAADASVVQGDAGRARTELGWIPRIPVEQTLRDTLDWWRKEIPAA